MRYRRLSYRYTAIVRSSPAWPAAELWEAERLRLLVHGGWRPDADVYETAGAIEMLVDLAAVDEGDFEVQLFEDVVVVEGLRQSTPSDDSAVYHLAGIRRGPFRVELPLPVPVDADRVEARYERGLLRITLPKRGEA